MMEQKRILCYGDSNTWGHIPGDGRRFAPELRWTGRLAAEFAGQCVILEEGLNGRSTVFDDDCLPCRNGLKGLGYALVSQKPIDVLILSLGTNDLKHTDAAGSAKGLERLLRLCTQASVCFDSGVSPIFRDGAGILVVSPIHLHPQIALRRPESSLAKKYEASLHFAEQLAPVAARYGAAFVDAAQYAAPSEIDCVHLDAEGHAALSAAIGRALRGLLTDGSQKGTVL